jgi:hypothetical protein
VHLTDEKYITSLCNLGYYASPVQFKLAMGFAAGDPDYRGMSPALADSIGQQLPGLRQWFEWLGDWKRRITLTDS